MAVAQGGCACTGHVGCWGVGDRAAGWDGAGSYGERDVYSDVSTRTAAPDPEKGDPEKEAGSCTRKSVLSIDALGV
jgi:hypothetical protein